MNTLSLADIVTQHEELLELTFLAKLALLHPDLTARNTAKLQLQTKYEGVITGGFVGDDQLFVTVNYKGESKIAYLGDMPPMYAGKKFLEPHPFKI